MYNIICVVYSRSLGLDLDTGLSPNPIDLLPCQEHRGGAWAMLGTA